MLKIYALVAILALAGMLGWGLCLSMAGVL